MSSHQAEKHSTAWYLMAAATCLGPDLQPWSRWSKYQARLDLRQLISIIPAKISVSVMVTSYGFPPEKTRRNLAWGLSFSMVWLIWKIRPANMMATSYEFRPGQKTWYSVIIDGGCNLLGAPSVQSCWSKYWDRLDLRRLIPMTPAKKILA